MTDAGDSSSAAAVVDLPAGPATEAAAPLGEVAASQAWGDVLSRRRIAMVLISVMLGMLLSALDQTVVGTAMPRVIADLNGLQHYAWVATGYLLVSAASMPIWGKLSDAFGRRRFFMVGMVLFVVGSALCGQSHSMVELIGFRALQGLGAGAMMPITQAIIGDIFNKLTDHFYERVTYYGHTLSTRDILQGMKTIVDVGYRVSEVSAEKESRSNKLLEKMSAEQRAAAISGLKARAVSEIEALESLEKAHAGADDGH
jgi:hypothetical protein